MTSRRFTCGDRVLIAVQGDDGWRLRPDYGSIPAANVPLPEEAVAPVATAILRALVQRDDATDQAQERSAQVVFAALAPYRERAAGADA